MKSRRMRKNIKVEHKETWISKRINFQFLARNVFFRAPSRIYFNLLLLSTRLNFLVLRINHSRQHLITIATAQGDSRVNWNLWGIIARLSSITHNDSRWRVFARLSSADWIICNVSMLRCGRLCSEIDDNFDTICMYEVGQKWSN
jgi:hypothetical protein